MSNYTSAYTGAQIDNAVAMRTLIGSTAPTTSTVGVAGQRYFDTVSELGYECTSASGGTYIWKISDITATISKVGKVATITITDKNGTTTETINDGADGVNGSDGISEITTATDTTISGLLKGASGKVAPAVKSDITALGIPSQDTTYSEATTSIAGLMSSGDKAKLNNIATGADVSVNADWNASSGKAQILNKPSIPTVAGDVGLGNVDNVKQMPISGGVLENYREKLVTLSGISTTINLSSGNVFTHTLTGNTTYSITNAVNSQAHSFTLIINMGSTVRTLTFPASVKWQGGEIPDLSTASKTYVLTFMTVDGGTTWLGMFGGEF